MDVDEFAISKAKKHAVSQKGCLRPVSRGKGNIPRFYSKHSRGFPLFPGHRN